jgi:hypothetical protein
VCSQPLGLDGVDIAIMWRNRHYAGVGSRAEAPIFDMYEILAANGDAWR